MLPFFPCKDVKRTHKNTHKLKWFFFHRFSFYFSFDSLPSASTSSQHTSACIFQHFTNNKSFSKKRQFWFVFFFSFFLLSQLKNLDTTPRENKRNIVALWCREKINFSPLQQFVECVREWLSLVGGANSSKQSCGNRKTFPVGSAYVPQSTST